MKSVISSRPVHWLWILGAAGAAMPVLAAAQDSIPVLEAVTLYQDNSGPNPFVRPEFHFRDATGNVRFIHRELVATNLPNPPRIRDAVIDIPADLQIAGATFVGGWHCGPESYYVTLRAFVLTVDGSKSNSVDYTIHCNGG